MSKRRKVYDGGNALGSNPTDQARSQLLQKRLDEAGPKTLGEPGTVNAWEVRPDPRVHQLQRNLIHRWEQEFIAGKAEGRAGENPNSKLGTGPRKTIDCLKNPLRFRSMNTGQIRKTKTQRLIESGRTSEALSRIKKNRCRTRPGTIQDARKMDVDADCMSTQTGLFYMAKKTYDKIKDERRLDAISV